MSGIISATANGKAIFIVAFLLMLTVVYPRESLKFLNKTLQRLPESERGNPPPCPAILHVSWLAKPPLFKQFAVTNSSESGHHFGGIILYEVLDLALYWCCIVRVPEGKKPTLLYKLQSNKSGLHDDILGDKADLILPVQSDDEEKYQGYLTYFKIFESPGIALIKRTYHYQRGDGKSVLLWNAIASCWPIVVLTLLLSLVAGMCVWAMETKKNTKEFGSPFYRGIFDGFWWAFVTMTTVGYGDKTPKSIIARLFTVMWIMIGVAMCSILTATLSSALTSIRVEKADVFPGMKVGVVSDSIAHQKAENLGMEVTEFEDLDEVYDALVYEQSVDGILEELLIAREYLEQKENPLSSIVHVFEEKHGFGVAFNVSPVKLFGEDIGNCMSKVFAFASDTNYAVKREHRNKGFTKKHTPITDDAQVDNAIDQKSPVFIGTVFGLFGFTLVFFTVNMMLKYFRGQHVAMQSQDVKTGQQNAGKISRENVASAWDGKRLEFSITEIVTVPLTQHTPGKKRRSSWF